MSIKPDDPRVRKTRRGLREALVRLILRIGYDAISIQDIANEAETARITFYRHYHDKEALLVDCLNTLYEELEQKTERISPEGLQSGYSPLSALYEHMEEQEQLYRILFSSLGTHTVMERLRHHIAASASVTIRHFAPAEALVAPEDIITHHVASAQIGLAMWWLDHNKPYPAAYMAQISVWLSLGGTARAVGISHFKLPPPTTPSG
ncbi:MAG: TetR/AcrR family transcriptional regulator [Armatimonadetes bacterium]|nr:TetR/AcrR family transcriptional regulator [Anaerolineae bacterium]